MLIRIDDYITFKQNLVYIYIYVYKTATPIFEWYAIRCVPRMDSERSCAQKEIALRVSKYDDHYGSIVNICYRGRGVFRSSY